MPSDSVNGRHFDELCKMLLVSSLCLAYAYVMDAFTTFYGGDYADKRLCLDKISGSYSAVYWATVLLDVLLPQLMWFKRLRLNEALIMLVCFGVIVGMWCERYTIVVMSLRRTHLPSTPLSGWATLLGTVGLFASGILLAVRFLPVISMFEMRALIQHHSQEAEHE